MRLALVQMEIAEKNRALNISHGLELLREAAGQADVAVLPEVWTTGYSLGALHREAENASSALLGDIAAIARENNTTIVAGSMPFKRQDEKTYNTMLVYGKDGGRIAEYDKVHMFGLYNEEKYFKAGSRRVQFELDGMKAGAAICYDLRFPELFRAMALEGTEMVFLPAEWPASRGDAWRLLVQARAVESQLYMCAVNCVGRFRQDVFYGHSMLVAPDGTIVAEGNEKEEIIYADVKPELVASVRGSMSVLTDVRSEVYRL